MRPKSNLPDIRRIKRSKSVSDIDLGDIGWRGITQCTKNNDNALLTDLLWAINEGDGDFVRRYAEDGFNMMSSDYDKRTPLHIAAATGHVDIVLYLTDVCHVDKQAPDRWGFTAYDEARRFGHSHVASLLVDDIQLLRQPCEDTDDSSIDSIGDQIKLDTWQQEETISRLLYRAKEGNLQALKRFHTIGVNMNLADYDQRTALHVAAAEGHMPIVRYLIEKCHVNMQAKDRWNNLPIDEAQKFNHDKVQTYLKTCFNQFDETSPECLPSEQHQAITNINLDSKPTEQHLADESLLDSKHTGQHLADESLLDSKPTGQHLADESLLDSKPTGQHLADESLLDSKHTEQHLADESLLDSKPTEQHLADESLLDSKPTGQHLADESLLDSKPTGQHLADESLLDSKPTGQHLADESLLDSKPTGQHLADESLLDSKPTGQHLADESLLDSKPTEQHLADESLLDSKPTGQHLADESLLDSKHTEQHLADESLLDSKPTEQHLADESLLDSKPTGQHLADESLLDSKPTGQHLADESLLDSKPTGQHLADESLLDSKPTEQHLADESLLDSKHTRQYLADESLLDSKPTGQSLPDDSLLNSKPSEQRLTDNSLLDSKTTDQRLTEYSVLDTKITDQRLTNDSYLDSRPTELRLTDDSLLNGKQRLADDSLLNSKTTDQRLTEDSVVDSRPAEQHILTEDSLLDKKQMTTYQTEFHLGKRALEGETCPKESTSETRLCDIRVVLTGNQYIEKSAMAKYLQQHMQGTRVELLNEKTEEFHLQTSSKTTYLLVLDMTKPVSEQLQKCHHLHYYLAIAAHKKNTEPSVILIGVDKDKLQENIVDRDEHISDFFEKVRQELDETPAHQYIDPQDFVFSSEHMSQENLDQLSCLTENIQKKRQRFQMHMKCLLLENELRKMTQKIITKKEIWHIIEKHRIPIENDEELFIFLDTLTRTGNIIFLNEEKTKDHVILDRQWFTDAFMAIINLKRCHRNQANLRKPVQKLQKSGQLNIQLLKVLWSWDIGKAFWNHKDVLLCYLESFKLVTRVLNHNPDGTEKQDMLFIPCCLKHSSASENGNINFVFRNETKSLPLVYRNEGNYFPPVLFNAIRTKLLDKYKVHSSYKNQSVFADIGVYQIGPDLLGITQLLHEAVELRVVNMSNSLPNTERCKYFNDSVKFVIDEHIQNCSSTCSETCNFRPAVRCHCGDSSWIDLETLYIQGNPRCHGSNEKHFFDKNIVEMQWFSDYSNSSQVSVPDNNIAQLAAQVIGIEWKYLGEHLGIDYTKYENIPTCTSHKISKMIKQWRDEKGEEATRAALYDKMKMTYSIDLHQAQNVLVGFVY